MKRYIAYYRRLGDINAPLNFLAVHSENMFGAKIEVKRLIGKYYVIVEMKEVKEKE